MAYSRDDYLDLFAETEWGAVSARFEMVDDLPDSGLIANVNVVPFVGELCLILRLASGEWEVPGGTLEPGETYLDGARRELLEEAGARLISFYPFGGWRC